MYICSWPSKSQENCNRLAIGTRTCAFVVCVRLHRITRIRNSSNEASKGQRWRVAIYELLLILVLPIIVMALFIVVLPFRLQILQEEGCTAPSYSYISYIIFYSPELMISIGCAILAPLTLTAFLLHRKEMNEYFTARSSEDITRNKYKRLMVVASLDTIFNLPVLMVVLITSALSGNLRRLL